MDILGWLFPISFYRHASRFIEFQTKVAHLWFLPCLHKICRCSHVLTMFCEPHLLNRETGPFFRGALASQKIAIVNRCVFKSQFWPQVQLKNHRKSRNEIANHCVLKSQIRNRNVCSLPKQHKQVEGVPIFRHETSLRFWGGAIFARTLKST